MAKQWSIEELKFIRANPTKTNSELMAKFNCTRAELSEAIKRTYRNQNRDNRYK